LLTCSKALGEDINQMFYNVLVTSIFSLFKNNIVKPQNNSKNTGQNQWLQIV